MDRRETYFRDCVGADSYTPTHVGLYDAVHHKTVRQALSECAGELAADVIVGLVKQHQLNTQRTKRFPQDLKRLLREAEEKAEQAKLAAFVQGALWQAGRMSPSTKEAMEDAAIHLQEAGELGVV